MAIGTVSASASLALEEIDVGDAVIVSDPAVVNPTTGARLATAATVNGLVTEARIDWRKRTQKYTVAVSDSARLALFAPSALVISYADPEVTVEQREYTHDGAVDARRFAVGDVCILVDTHLEIIAATTTGSVSKVTDDVIEFSTDQFDVDPKAGDIIMFADYDAVRVAQRASYAYGAEGGSAGNDPELGVDGDPPYLIGD